MLSIIRARTLVGPCKECAGTNAQADAQVFDRDGRFLFGLALRAAFFFFFAAFFAGAAFLVRAFPAGVFFPALAFLGGAVFLAGALLFGGAFFLAGLGLCGFGASDDTCASASLSSSRSFRRSATISAGTTTYSFIG
jgi:hypothetical protein